MYQLYGHKVLIHGILLIILLLNLIIPSHLSAQETPEKKVETISIDTTAQDSTQKQGGFLSSKVEYDAADSMIIKVKEQKAYLYGDAIVKYENLELKAEYIEINFGNDVVYATGVPDSTGKIIGSPIFKEAGKEYFAKRMTYNFRTKKGKIHNAMTQEGEGYVHGSAIKKHSEEVFFIKGGKYTTCNQEHPHFHISAKKLKIINGEKKNKIITGPANLVIEGVETPIAIPFGFFPNKSERQSGIILPAYGENRELGFNLNNGGFYWAVSDNADLMFKGDIYTNGTWAGRALSTYKKRYKYNGNFDFNYSNRKQGDKATKDYSETESFFINWSHRQDPKARPHSSFSASVNAGSSNHFQNDFNTAQSNPNNLLRNQFKSNISYNQKIPNTLFNFTLNANHSQNSNDSSISVTLPQAVVTMSRFQPFEKLTKNWNRKNPFRDIFKNFGVNITADGKSEVTTKEKDFLKSETIDKAQSGAQFSIPVMTSFKLSYINIGANANYTERWFFKTLRKRWDNESKRVLNDTVPEFRRYGTRSYGASMSTKFYGMYSYKRGRIKAIRHVMTPLVGISYTPKQYTESQGYFKEYQSDSAGTMKEYSIFENNIYSGPSTSKKQASLSFGLQNSIEMKYKSESDTGIVYKKVKLLEALNFNSGYDIYADSLNWSPVTVQARNNIGNYITLQAGAVLNPYAVDTNGTKINKAEYDVSGNFFRIPTINGTVGLNFKSKEKKGKEERKNLVRRYANDPFYNDILNNPNAYVDFNIPWSVNINYSMNYSKIYKPSAKVDGKDYRLINTLNFSGDVNVTENWKVSCSSGYDFELKKLNFTTLSIHRNIHCWQINFNVIPFGTQTSYSFDIGIKASILQDLKYNKRSVWTDNR